MKTIRRYEQNEMKNFLREMAVMSQLMHPNIIHLHGVVKQRELCSNKISIWNIKYTLLLDNWIVLEYFPRKDLKTFLSVSIKLYLIMSTLYCLKLLLSQPHNHDCIDPQACTKVADEVHDRCGHGNALPI